MLTFQTSLPDNSVRPFVHSYTQRDAHLAPGIKLEEPVFARLSAILEFQFAGPYDVPRYGIDKKNLSEPIAVIGPITWRSARIVIQGHVQALAVVFEPFGFHALFGVPVSPMADIGVEGHALLGGSVSVLYQRLGNTDRFEQRVRILDDFFVRRLATLRRAPPAALGLKNLISSARPIQITDIVKQTGISERQLERMALQQIGMSPVMMRRIARFQRALRVKVASGRPWTDIAHAAGYYDQMHMVRDFRELAGATPGAAFKQLSPNHISRLVL